MNRKTIGSIIALLVIAIVVAGLLWLLRGQGLQTAVSLDSPLPTPPSRAATPTPEKPTPERSPTRPPDPTRPPATLTPTPGPPTPTPEPLPTLIPGRDTIVYSTTGEHRPEIWRVQLDGAGRITEPGLRVHGPVWWNSWANIRQLYPSPDGNKVAIQWGSGESSFVSILDIDTGGVVALKSLVSDKQIQTEDMLFFDWHPDSESVLVYSGNGSPDVGWKLLAINVHTGWLEKIDFFETAMNSWIRDASFSPKGDFLYYASSDCFGCGSQIWRLDLEAKKRKPIVKIDGAEVATIALSPNGQHLAYTQLQDKDYFAGYGIGELWSVSVDGGERRFLGEALTSFYREFDPVWSPDSERVAFFVGSGSGNRLDDFTSNVFLADIEDGVVVQLSHLEDRQAANLVWTPGTDMAVFVASLADGSRAFEPWLSSASEYSSQPFDAESSLILDSAKSNPVVLWLPTYWEMEDKE